MSYKHNVQRLRRSWQEAGARSRRLDEAKRRPDLQWHVAAGRSRSG